MRITADNFRSTTIPALIEELESDSNVRDYMFGQNLNSDWLEAVATHIIMTDTDFIAS